MTWWNSEAYCKENGGYLVSIHDENTNNYIKGQVRNNDFDIGMLLQCMQMMSVFSENPKKSIWIWRISDPLWVLVYI